VTAAATRQMVDAFVQRAERAGCRVARADPRLLSDAEWWDRLLNGDADQPLGRPSVAVAPALLDAYPEVGAALIELGGVRSVDIAELARCVAGVCAAVAGIAETGSLLMVGEEPADRLAWLIPPRSIVVLGEGDIVPSLDQATAWLAARRDIGAATFVTGPSRTSDVERVLTIGVQGPREVVIVLVAGGGN
jgi:L-lactate dehydrogenase complex protein LldG